jgi:diguanylate cyclase (GGDEF)-like protein
MTTYQENIEKRVKQLSNLKQLVMEIAKIRDLEVLFQHIASKAPRMLEAEDCAVLLVNPDSKELIFRSSKSRKTGISISPDTTSILVSVFKSQEVRVSDNAIEEPDFNIEISAAAGLQPTSLIAAPIVLNNESIGVIEVINRENGSFNEYDEEVLTTIASHIADAIEANWLNTSSERRLSELSILVEISKSISTAYDLDTLFENISEKLTKTTHLTEFSVSSWDREKDQILTLMDCIKCDVGRFKKVKGSTFPLDQYPVTRAVLENRKIEIIDAKDPLANKNEVEQLRKHNVPIIMLIPMIVRNNVTGLLEIYFPNQNPIFVQSKKLYQSIANQIGAAIENTRLHEETRQHALDLEQRVVQRTKELERLYEQQAALTESERKQRKLVETLQEAGAIVASTLDPGSAITEILNQLSRVIPHDSASIQLLNDDELVIVAGGGWLEFENMQGYRFPIPGDNPNTLVLNQMSPIILNHESLLSYEEFQKASHGAIHSWLGVPLITQDMAIGMLTLDSAQDNYFKEEHANLAIAFADQVAVALEQAILFQKTQAALAERDALRAIMGEITGELNLPNLLATVLVKTCELLGAMSAEVALYNPQFETLEVVAVHKEENDSIGKQIPVGEGLMGQVALLEKPILVNNYSTWEHALLNFEHATWQAAMCVPLIYHQRLIGVIAVGDKRKDKQFTESDIELLTMLGQQVAIAIENAQLFKKVQILATTDELTGLPNRRELFRVGSELFELSKSDNIPLSAIMLDIDLFKSINDTYGHSTGDQVLTGLARLCSKLIRENDILCRYGGEEFTLILPGANLNTANRVAERLRKAFETTPLQTDRGDVLATVSFGVATLNAKHASLAALVDEADAAMYKAKNLGRNRVEVFKTDKQ